MACGIISNHYLNHISRRESDSMEHDGCVGCKYESQSRHLEPCISCDGTKTGDHYKRITHGDKIRSMSDEELAEFIVGLSEHCLAGIGNVDCSENKDCRDRKCIVTKWLQSEVEE